MISVIVPIYNVEKYLEKCIRSIQDNTYKDLEIICINDGSPDQCLSILHQLSEEDPRITIIDQENQGVQKARNNGIKVAKGEFISFIDSDDWIHPQYFESLLKCMESTGADIAVCSCKKFNEGELVEVKKNQSIHYKRLSGSLFFKSYYARHMCWGRLYRKCDLDNIIFVSEVGAGDDTLFNLSVISNLPDPIVYETDTPLYFYLQRSNSIVNTSSYKKMISFSKWVADKHRIDEQKKWSWMLAMQALKMALSYRYAAKLYKDYEASDYANLTIKKIIRMINCSQLVSRKEKLIHVIAFWFPWIYRYFRIKDDPSMKEWEKSVKSKYKTVNL